MLILLSFIACKIALTALYALSGISKISTPAIRAKTSASPLV